MVTRTVPTDFATIGAAAAVSQSGDIINVIAGYSGSETSAIPVSGLTIHVSQRFGQIALTLQGPAESLTATGIGDVHLIGNAANNILTGNDGLNFLRGGPGNDTLDGRGGFDFADYAFATGPVQVTLTDPTTPNGPTGGFSSGPHGSDTLINIEGIRGSAHNDTLTGNSSQNFLRGGVGDDTLIGGGGHDYADYFNASAGVQVTLTDPTTPDGPSGGFSAGPDGADTLIGISSIQGSTFNDILTGNSASNYLRGSLGDDILRGGGPSERVGSGGDYADYWSASGPVQVTLTDPTTAGGPTGGFSAGADGKDTLEDIENIQGGGFGDTLTGNSQANILRGNGGDDIIDGKGGLDFASYWSATGPVVVTLTDPVGGISGGSSSGADGNDTLISIEQIGGSNFADTLKGNSEDNLLQGNGGDDTIEGGGGIDTAYFQGKISEYTITQNANSSYTIKDNVAGREGTDTLTGVEKFQFSNQTFDAHVAMTSILFGANPSQAKAVSAIHQVLLDGVPSAEGFDFLVKGNLATNFGAGPGPNFNDENIFINVANALVQGNATAASKFGQLAAGATIEAKIGSLYSKLIPAGKQTADGLSFITRPEGIKFYQDVAIERGITSENGPAVVALASLLKIAVDGKMGVGNAVSDFLLSVADGSSELPATSTDFVAIETIDGTKYDADDTGDAASTTPPPMWLSTYANDWTML